MRHHSTSIVGPGKPIPLIDGVQLDWKDAPPEYNWHLAAPGWIGAAREQAMWDAMWPQTATVNVRLIEDESGLRVQNADPYPSDLLAAIPWAKDAGLRLRTCWLRTDGTTRFGQPSRHLHHCGL